MTIAVQRPASSIQHRYWSSTRIAIFYSNDLMMIWWRSLWSTAGRANCCRLLLHPPQCHRNRLQFLCNWSDFIYFVRFYVRIDTHNGWRCCRSYYCYFYYFYYLYYLYNDRCTFLLEILLLESDRRKH